MKFKLITLCSILVLMTQSLHPTSNIQDFVTNLTAIYHKDSSSKQKKVDFEDEFKKFIADGGNLNGMFIDPETGAFTTPLFFSINNQLLYLTFLSLKYGADPLHVSLGGKSAIDCVLDEYFDDFSKPMGGDPCVYSAREVEQGLRIINFALLISYVPKDKRKQIIDDVLQKIVHEYQVHEILIDDWVEDLKEDFSELLSDYDELKKEFKDKSNTYEDRLLIAIGLLTLEAHLSIFQMYLELLPDDEQAKYLQDFQLPKPHTKSLEKSKWFHYVSLKTECLPYILCA